MVKLSSASLGQMGVFISVGNKFLQSHTFTAFKTKLDFMSASSLIASLETEESFYEQTQTQWLRNQVLLWVRCVCVCVCVCVSLENHTLSVSKTKLDFMSASNLIASLETIESFFEHCKHNG